MSAMAAAGPPVVRPPAVAGTFYESDPARLRAWLGSALADARARGQGAAARAAPKVLIVPHAGYAYSGAVAAAGYAAVSAAGWRRIRRVVLLGPSHFVPVAGLAVSPADAFGTPLGTVPVDRQARSAVRTLPGCEAAGRPHAREHSLEVQVPFLQAAADRFTLVPIAVGRARPRDVAEALALLWGGPETLIVISTDLSHYLGYQAAVARDRRTARAILALDPSPIGDTDACGARPLRGVLLAAARHGLRASLLDLRNSGDSAGDRDRVVGYGAFALG